MFTLKTNREILAARYEDLTVIERQRRFILGTLSTAVPCPHCGMEQSYFEATGITVDDYDAAQKENELHHCKNCHHALRYTVPIIRPLVGPGWCWRPALEAKPA